MKTRLLIIAMLFTCNWLYSQHDLNWVIADKWGIEILVPPYPYPPPSPVANYNLLTLNSQDHIIFDGFLPLANTNASHDWFIIYKDGTYTNTYTGQGPTIGTNQSIHSSNNKYYYDPPSSGKIPSYTYLTTKYEEGDVIGEIKVGTDTGNPPNTSLSTLLNAGKKGTFVNHDLVVGKDVTFIIDESIVSRCDTGEYITISMNSPHFELIPEVFHTTNNNSISNHLIGSGVGLTNNPSSTGNLTNTQPIQIQIDNNNKGCNIFLNYRLNEIPDDIESFNVTFNLSACDTVLELDMNVSHSEFHDPNYAELQCVWEENGRKYAKYHVECFNNGQGAVNDLEIGFELPDLAIPSSIQFYDWAAKGKTGCGLSNRFKLIYSNPSSSYVKVLFSDGLCGYGNGLKKKCYTAWLEFVVKLDQSTDLQKDNLRLGLPQTTFMDTNDTVNYHINTFIDHDTCIHSSVVGTDPNANSNHRSDSLGVTQLSNSSACEIVRKVSPTSCVMPCKPKSWCQIIIEFFSCWFCS